MLAMGVLQASPKGKPCIVKNFSELFSNDYSLSGLSLPDDAAIGTGSALNLVYRR
jgi:hypothetical protein